MSPMGADSPTVPPAAEQWPGWSAAAAPLRVLTPGDAPVIGPYRLEALLGEGGMGRVFLGRTPAGRAVAIKVVHRQYASDESFRKRFEREVATAKQVHGLYTAPVVAADVDAEEPWLATAYVPGPSLQYAVTEHGPMGDEAALRLIAGVAEALQSIHAAGVTHRDLKPSNVILAADGPTVIDFGIARAADVTSITGTDVRPGTPAYMAPEQVRGEPLTPAADIFALGVLAAFAATGRPAFGGGEGVAYRILEQAPNLDGCPEPVRTIATACLIKDGSRRPIPVEVVELCQDALAGRPGGTGHSPSPKAGVTDHAPTDGGAAPIEPRHPEPASTPRAPDGDTSAIQEADSALPSVAGRPVLDAGRPLTRPTVRPAPTASPPDLKVKRRRIRLFILLSFVLLVLAGGGAATTWVVVNQQYFVGEGEDGQIAIFQGVRGSILGISLNTQVQGSCDPDVSTCDKFYVNDLRQLGRDAIRSGTSSFDNIPDARQFIQDLRTKYPLPTCESLIKQQEQEGSAAAPVEPEPGVNCRPPRGDGGGG